MRKERWAQGVIRYRGAILALGAAVTIAAAPLLLTLQFDETLTSWIPEGDPSVTTYERFIETFDVDELSVVAIFADDVLSPEALQAVRTLTRELETLPHIRSVLSLANARVVEATPEGVELVALLPDPSNRTMEAAAVKERIVGSRARLQGLLSNDLRASAIVLELTTKGRDFFAKRELLAELRPILEGHRSEGMEFEIAGTLPLDATFMELTKRDALVLGPLSLTLILLTGLLVFRRPVPVVAILLVVSPTLTLVYALMSVLGLPVDMVTSSLGTVILTLGVADTFHVVSAFHFSLRDGEPPKMAARKAIEETLVPCFFTSVTTAAGLLSLTTSPLAPIANFGLLAGLGILLALALSVTCLPAFLSFVPGRWAQPPPRPTLGPVFERCSALATAHPRRVVLGAIVLGAVCSAGLWQLDVGTSRVHYFLPNDPVLRATSRVDEALGGTANLELLLTAQDFANPQAVAALGSAQTLTAELSGIRHTASVLEPLDDIHRGMTRGQSPPRKLSQPLVAQYLLVLEGDPRLGKLMTPDRRHARVTARLPFEDVLVTTGQLAKFEKALRSLLQGSGVTAEVTGLVPLMARMKEALLQSQLTSFGWAFGVVTLLLCVLLRSLPLGLLAMLPNLLPVIATLGLMGLSGTPLDPATVMVASIAIGLVVDDTVHFLVAFRAQNELSRAEAVRAALRKVGSPIVATSIVLAAGYAALFAGSFRPTHNFAVVTLAMVALALIADLVVLPALLCLSGPRSPVVNKEPGGSP